MAKKPTYEELERRVEDLENAAEERAEVEQGLLSMLTEAEKLAHLGAWEWDLQNDRWTMSENWLRIHGCSKGHLSSGDLLPIAHPDDRSRIREAFERASRQGEPYEMEHRIVRQDTGEIRYVRAYGAVKLDSSGKPRKLIGATLDITEHKKAEQLLSAERERFLMLLEMFPGFIYLLRPDHTIAYANRYFVDHFGSPLNKPCHQLFHNQALPCDTCPTLGVLETRTPRVQEWSDAPDGRRYQLHDFPFTDADGSELVLKIGLDITAQKEALEALEQSQGRLVAMMEHSPALIYLLNRDNEMVFVNQVWETVFQITKADVIGKSIFDLFPKETANQFAGVNRDVFEKGTPVEAEETVPQPDGPHHYLTIKFLLPASSESERLLCGISTDITERVTLEAAHRAAQKIEAIGTLAGGVAHEFNNVLSIILGNASLALDELEPDHPIQMYLEEVQTASLRARDVVKQLLTFGRKVDVKREPLDILLTVKESLKLLRAAIPAHIRIHEILPADVDYIDSHPTEIHQLTINLCNNAAHAMRDEGGRLVIELKNVQLDPEAASKHPDLIPGAYVRLSVVDTGQGIPTDLMEKIFEPYFTTKEPGEGTGMGLAVVHGIVKAHRGAIHIESGVDSGTAVHVYFPASSGSPREEEPREPTLPTGSEQILLVDDEPSVGRIGASILGKLGYTVTLDTQPEQTLRRFQSDPEAWDLVVTDMMMPGITGDRLARKLLEIRPDIPIVICTGFSERLSKDTAQQMGIKALLMKPMDADELANTVRDVLDEAEARRAKR